MDCASDVMIMFLPELELELHIFWEKPELELLELQNRANNWNQFV